MSEHRIVRTVGELGYTDVSAILMSCSGAISRADDVYSDSSLAEEFLPAVVIATGEQVRAACTALQEAVDE